MRVEQIELSYVLPGDVSASDRYYERAVVIPPFHLNSDGTIDVPRGPGIGVEVDREFLETVTVRRESFRHQPLPLSSPNGYEPATPRY